MRGASSGLFSVVCLAMVALASAACDDATAVPPPQGDARTQALARIGLAGDGALAGDAAALEKVKLDPPPEVGKHYAPRFGPDLPFDPGPGSGWKTTTPKEVIGVPTAKKGGTLRIAMDDWLPTLRTEGPNSRLSTLSKMHNLIFEPLLGYDFALGDYVPALATHWWISEDIQTFRFRLNSKARWSDGREVTADDVVGTIEHLRSRDRKDPLVSQQWQELIAEVKALDRLTVEFRVKQKEWRSFLLVATQIIYPAAYMRMDGETYIAEWSWKLPPGSGPYTIKQEDVLKGRSISLTRRMDWWDRDNPHKRGMYNFDKIRWEVVREDELMYQKLRTDELDLYLVTRAQQWVDEAPRIEEIRRGWVQMRKVFTKVPQGFGGYCFNMREPPFDKRNIRAAFAYLNNREKSFAKFTYFQYLYQDSYFPGQVYRRPDAEPTRFDPEKARALLAQEGWTKRDAEGFLVNEKGERFPVLTLEFASQGFERLHRIVVDDLWNEAGIKLELKLIDYPTMLKKVWDHKFQLCYWGWTASAFPDMDQMFHSKYAMKKQSNNLSGFADPEVDKLLDAYKTELDFEKRKAMYRRLDAILFEAHPYALGWYAPYFRVLYWDRFGHPPEYSDSPGDYPDAIFTYWWFDDEKDAQLKAARSRGEGLYQDRKPRGQYDPPDARHWLDNDLPMKDPRRDAAPR